MQSHLVTSLVGELKYAECKLFHALSIHGWVVCVVQSQLIQCLQHPVTSVWSPHQVYHEHLELGGEGGEGERGGDGGWRGGKGEGDEEGKGKEEEGGGEEGRGRGREHLGSVCHVTIHTPNEG